MCIRDRLSDTAYLPSIAEDSDKKAASVQAFDLVTSRGAVGPHVGSSAAAPKQPCVDRLQLVKEQNRARQARYRERQKVRTHST